MNSKKVVSTRMNKDHFFCKISLIFTLIEDVFLDLMPDFDKMELLCVTTF